MNVALKEYSSLNHYWNLIRDAEDEVKLQLITKLSESLISKRRAKEKSKSVSKKTREFLETCGTWSGPETAEEIISAIHSHRTINEGPNFDEI